MPATAAAGAAAGAGILPYYSAGWGGGCPCSGGYYGAGYYGGDLAGAALGAATLGVVGAGFGYGPGWW